MSAEDHKQALPPGFELGAYRVVRVLGVGGFGVTYLCEHAGLGVQVAVKEYLPNEIAVRDGAEVHPKSAGDREGFEWGLSRVLDEARTLARFEHPNVVRVRDCFEANNTAYIVMDYEDGEPLDALLRRHGTLTEAQLKRVLLPVADGLRQVHAAGFLHRDVKPANVFVRRSDESPVLLDFGSARQALGRRSRSVTAIASAGYSPPEQYESGGAQGAWTDIYALSALCYRAITGDAPLEATQRQSQLLRTQTDPLPRLAEVGREGYSPTSLEAVDWGLRLIETERPQSLDEWLAALEGAAGRRQSGDSKSRQAKQPASPPTTYQTGKRKAHWGRSRAAWLAAGLGSLLAIGLVWSATQKDAGQPFTVLVEPADARVRILNIGLPYRVGMELAAGSYEIEASAPGYVTKTETVAHGTTPTLHRISLSLLGQPFTVRVEPADARVRILNIDSSYNAAMELAAGSYEVEASAPGYVTKTETVAHGAAPTVHRMALSLLAQPFTVLVEPADARVRILNVGSPYTAAMELAAGPYEVEATAPGYATKTETVAHGTTPTVHRMALSLIGQPFTVLVEPADAQVRILNISPPYRAGMELAAGSYEVEASAPGYATKTETVAHGTAPTVHQMALSLLDAGIWYRKAAEQGDAVAQFNLGLLYRLGDGVPKDAGQAAIWFRKAAEQGLAVAQFNLGFLYYQGEGVPRHRPASTVRPSCAGLQRGPAPRLCGTRSRPAQHPPEDAEQAAIWYHKAAEQGDADAQFNLGLLYGMGNGVPKDAGQVAIWFRKAAEQGHAGAQRNLGELYWQGDGVPKDAGQAAIWFRKAAEQGLALAQFNLGILYYQGEGVPKNLVQSYAWLNLASAGGHQTAKDLRTNLERRMTRTQVADAQRLSRDLID